ncbi:hypothetical protein KW782_03880 [Candidatus Parcubacteria bacterium]|nr:hypothetical protein [Candidatus Parcubacteria bacterium]
MTQTQSQTEDREVIGERVLLDPNILRSVRVNIEYTNPKHLPKDLEWKPKGNMARKQTRYKDKEQGRPLWQEFGGQRGDLVNVSLANLVVGLVNNGMGPIKAYNEERTGRKPSDPPKYRTTFVYMFPEMYEHRPEIMEILPKMDALRERSIRKERQLRRDSMYGHGFVKLNKVYDDAQVPGSELVDSGHFQLDITGIYKTPLVDQHGQPIRASNDTTRHYDDAMFQALADAGVENGQFLSPLYSIETTGRSLCLVRNRSTTRGEAMALAKDLAWTLDADSFAL